MHNPFRIRFNDLSRIHEPLKAAYMDRVSEVYSSSTFITGKYVAEFEKHYAGYCNSGFALGTGNGYDALKIAIKSLNLPAGSEIIVPAHTFIATWFAVTNSGYIPIGVDADSNTCNITAQEIRKHISKKTSAIVVVHLYGQACEMDDIIQLADEHKLALIEDNAQSQGATYKGKITGSFGQINATSFYPGKNIGAGGDAGAITTNSEELYKRAKMLRNYGSLQKYEHQIIGENSRMDELQAAFLSLKLEKLNEWNTERQQIAAYYTKSLIGIAELTLPQTAPHATSVFHLYVVRTPKRDLLQKHLAEKGIETIIHYPVPPHLQEAYKESGYKKGDFLITEEISNTCLSLPLFPKMTTDEMDYVISSVKEFFV